MEQLCSHWTDFHEIWYLGIFRKSIEKFEVHYYMTRVTDSLHADKYTFWIISRSPLLRMRTVSDKSCRGNQNTYFMFEPPPPPENHAVYEIMWKNILEPGGPQMTIWRMRLECWIYETTNTHRLINTYCFSTPTKVARNCHSVNVKRTLPVFIILDSFRMVIPFSRAIYMSAFILLVFSVRLISHA
jgi:hypothetical protein